jgi:hypothetical protein
VQSSPLKTYANQAKRLIASDDIDIQVGKLAEMSICAVSNLPKVAHEEMEFLMVRSALVSVFGCRFLVTTGRVCAGKR